MSFSAWSRAMRLTECAREGARGQVLLDLASQCHWWCERTKAVLRAQSEAWEEWDSFTEKPLFVPSLHPYTTDTVFCCSAPSFVLVPCLSLPPSFLLVFEQVAMVLASRPQMRETDSWLLRTQFGILDSGSEHPTQRPGAGRKHDKAVRHLAHGAATPLAPPTWDCWEVSLLTSVCVR